MSAFAELTAELDLAIVQRVARFGSENGLEPLTWEIVQYVDGPSLEGRPLTQLSGIADLQAWASALGMQEYAWDAENGSRSWHVEHGRWRVELRAN